MISPELAQSWISETLKAAGFHGRGTVWRLVSSEVQWVVHIDRLPYGKRLAVDIGLDLQAQDSRRRPTDCPVLLHLENLAIVTHLAVAHALDLESGLDPEQRRHEIEDAAHALARYILKHLTLKEVRDAFHAGDFTGFIHKDARAALEGASGASD